MNIWCHPSTVRTWPVLLYLHVPDLAVIPQLLYQLLTMPNPVVSEKISKLRSLVQLISAAAETLIDDWQNEAPDNIDWETVGGIPLPNPVSFDAQRTIVAAAASIEELVFEPQLRLMTFASQYFASRALHIAADHRIADLLDSGDGSGVAVAELSSRVGIEKKKLCETKSCAETQIEVAVR